MPHGGKRKGAGRPKGEPTKVLSVRVPERLYDRIRAAVLKLVERMSKAAPESDQRPSGERTREKGTP